MVFKDMSSVCNICSSVLGRAHQRMGRKCQRDVESLHYVLAFCQFIIVSIGSVSLSLSMTLSVSRRCRFCFNTYGLCTFLISSAIIGLIAQLVRAYG